MGKLLAATGEPALLLGAVNAVVALVISFGVHLTANQVGAINAATAALLAVLLRQSVSPIK